jgi:hypothetical protein
MSDRFAAHRPPAIRNLPARTRLFTIGAAAAITIGAAVAIPALLAPAAPPGKRGLHRAHPPGLFGGLQPGRQDPGHR